MLKNLLTEIRKTIAHAYFCSLVERRISRFSKMMAAGEPSDRLDKQTAKIHKAIVGMNRNLK